MKRLFIGFVIEDVLNVPSVDTIYRRKHSDHSSSIDCASHKSITIYCTYVILVSPQQNQELY
jgi:hypothetical protein